MIHQIKTRINKTNLGTNVITEQLTVGANKTIFGWTLSSQLGKF